MGPTFALRKDHIDAIGRAYREDFLRRIARYFELHQPDLAHGVDLVAFSENTLDFAVKHGIREEEGIVWLGAILLSARRARQPVDWIGALLDHLEKPETGAPPSEEDRLSAVHQEAVKRGLVAAKEAA